MTVDIPDQIILRLYKILQKPIITADNFLPSFFLLMPSGKLH